MTTVCGIDDAGRGPVIGPMVLAGVVLEVKDIPKLKTLGVTDSKLLTPSKRDKMYTEIILIAKKYKIIKIFPKEIDDAVLSNGSTNLNWLEAEKMAEIINYLKPENVVIDCPSNNKENFAKFLNSKIKVKTNLKCEHKADLNFIEVSAASILAKVTRDKEIELLKEKIGDDFGSGYPADPKTKKFLKDNWDKYPEIFRKSWSSYQVYSDGNKSKKQKTLGDF